MGSFEAHEIWRKIVSNLHVPLFFITTEQPSPLSATVRTGRIGSSTAIGVD